jgi:hypothetical protein
MRCEVCGTAPEGTRQVHGCPGPAQGGPATVTSEDWKASCWNPEVLREMERPPWYGGAIVESAAE